MMRLPQDPRPDAYALVEAEGLAYAREPDGGAYWHEDAAYAFTAAQIDRLEQVTADLHTMAMAATRWMAQDEPTLRRLGIPEYAWRPLRASLERDRTLYGRFDLIWDGESHPHLLEYNADTPAGLVEAAVSQWSWLETVHPDRDQWNLLHERLVQAWQQRIYPGEAVHLTTGEEEPIEDWNTLAYLADTITEAGGVPVVLPIERIGRIDGTTTLVDEADTPIRTCFKMYPWEWMLIEDFGPAAVGGDTQWCEPLYKVLTGSKALLPVLWQLYPGHPNLLPASWNADDLGPDLVIKPVYGWEGAGIQIVRDGEVTTAPVKHTAGQPVIYQQYREIPAFDGARPVLGTWVINGHPAGLGIRESEHLITDTDARFLPHYIDAPRSSPEEIAGWLRE
jgi:glutathionylspermidine synthase